MTARSLVFLAMTMVTFPVFATGSIARCDKTPEELKEVSDSLTSDVRLKKMKELVNDYQIVLEEFRRPNSVWPKNFLRLCVQRKAQTISGHSRLAGSDLRGRGEYLKIVGRFEMLQRNWGAAYIALMGAFRLDSNDYDTAISAARSWLENQQKELSGLQEKHTTKFEYEFQKINQDLFDPIIKNASLPSKLRIDMARLRAEIHYVIRNQLTLAEQDLRLILALDPLDREAAEVLARLSAKANDAITVRDAQLGLIRTGKRSRATYERLIEAQYQLRDYPAIVAAVQESQKSFGPLKSGRLLAYYALALFELGDFERSKLASDEAFKADKKNDLVRRMRAKHLERTANDFVKRGLAGPALASLDEAQKLDPQNVDFRIRLAELLYDSLMQNSSAEAAVQSTDRNKVLTLLEPLMNDGLLSRTQLEMMIAVGRGSSKAAIAARACDVLVAAFGDPGGSRTVLECANNYGLAKRPSDARAMIERALKDPRQKQEVPKLQEMLLKLP